MDLHSAFSTALDGHADASPASGARVTAANGTVSDAYASLMEKEQSVLDLVRRVDDTKRADALRDADRVAPLAHAFFAGFSGFLARLIHYASTGSTEQVVGLVSSPDGMIYAGTLAALIGVVLLCL